MRSMRWGRTSTAAVRDHRVGACHLHRRHRDAVTDRDRADRRARPLVERQREPGRLAREVDAGSRRRSRSGRPRTRAGPAPRRSAIVIVPMFEDCSTICLTVSRSVPRVCASWITRSATLIVGARRNDVRGVMIPSCRPARDGDELEGRSGLVRVRHRAVATPVGACRGEAVRVEARGGRHRAAPRPCADP